MKVILAVFVLLICLSPVMAQEKKKVPAVAVPKAVAPCPACDRTVERHHKRTVHRPGLFQGKHKFLDRLRKRGK